MKTLEWHERRRSGIGGSDANILMGGDAEKIHKLWEIKIGQAEPENLDWVLPVQIGVATEELNAAFFTHKTGRAITDRNRSYNSDQCPYMRCEVDGITTFGDKPAVWDAKHVNQFSNIADVTARYLPQMHHNAFVVGVRHYVLSVIIGTMTFEVIEGEIDDGYMMSLLNVEEQFWAAVQNKIPPNIAAVAAPTGPAIRMIDMSANNYWASNAADWIENKAASKKFDAAAKALKELVEPDVGVAYGHGIRIKRSKNGSLLIGDDR